MTEHKEESVIAGMAYTILPLMPPSYRLDAVKIISREVYDKCVLQQLRDAWNAGRRSHTSDLNPYEEGLARLR